MTRALAFAIDLAELADEKLPGVERVFQPSTVDDAEAVLIVRRYGRSYFVAITDVEVLAARKRFAR
jgi:hypothetical protein